MNHSSKFGYSEERVESAPDRERFELDVVAADEQSRSEIDSALSWRELVRGLSRIVGWFFTHERCGLILAMSDRAPESALTGRKLEIVEAVLCGAGQKTVAINLGLAPSTIALAARLGLAELGATGKPSRVHPLLMHLATAASERSLAASSLSFVASALGDLQVIGVPRPDRRLLGHTPAAELDVVRMLFEGSSYAAIARARGTSQRTVANQLAAAFKRLRISGRAELVHRLFRLEMLEQPSLDTVPPPTVRQLRPVPAMNAYAEASVAYRLTGNRC